MSSACRVRARRDSSGRGSQTCRPRQGKEKEWVIHPLLSRIPASPNGDGGGVTGGHCPRRGEKEYACGCHPVVPSRIRDLLYGDGVSGGRGRG